MTIKYDNAKKDAARTLTFYIKIIADKTGSLHWCPDNQNEVDGIISDIETMIDEKIKEALEKRGN